MATIILRKQNPWFKVGDLITEGLDSVAGAGLPTPFTPQELVEKTSDYINNIEFASSNRFEANKIISYRKAATALNNITEGLSPNTADSEEIYQLLNFDFNNTTATQDFLENIEERGFAYGDNVVGNLILVGAQVGLSLNKYWSDEIAAGGSSLWSTYLPSYQSKWMKEGIRSALMSNDAASPYTETVAAAIVGSVFSLIKSSL